MKYHFKIILMKSIFAVIALFTGNFAQAETCDLVSGVFKTMAPSDCRITFDGGQHWLQMATLPEHLKLTYEESNKALAIVDIETGKYLQKDYIADGKLRNGAYGVPYVAQCENNHIQITANEENHSILYEYIVTEYNKMVQKRTVQDTPMYWQYCNMQRIL